MPTALTHERQLDIIRLNKLETRVSVIGCGGIGSSTVLALAKFGITDIEVWDDDTLEVHNTANQMLPVLLDLETDKGMESVSQIGTNKVLLAHRLGQIMTGEMTVSPMFLKFDPAYTKALGKIVIMAVDSMEARRMIMDTCTENPEVFWVIDGRMSAEVAQINVIDLTKQDQIDKWYANWVPDADIPDAPCTAKATIYNSMLIGGFICSLVKCILVDRTPPQTVFHDSYSFLSWKVE